MKAKTCAPRPLQTITASLALSCSLGTWAHLPHVYSCLSVSPNPRSAWLSASRVDGMTMTPRVGASDFEALVSCLEVVLLV
jgi:hypothetical protein